ncbi:MAG: LapA family protein [Deltaproteobacteria bacterium]|jgi:uncharacterized integral membrane protein|nr:LapA family protein [Deltaproteobacteria bacterium]
MGLFRGIVFLILLIVGIGFAIQNDQPVSLKYYFGLVTPPLPLFLWAFLFVLLGLILSAVWAFISRIGLHSRIRLHRRSIEELERERDRLRDDKKIPEGVTQGQKSFISRIFGGKTKEGEGEQKIPPPA